MTLVVPCLDNIFMVLLISALATIGATKPIFWILVPLGGEGGVRACVGMVCYHCIVHIPNSSKNSNFFVSNNVLCRAMLPNYLRTCSTALCQIRALKKAFKKQNNGQTVPKILVLNAGIWLAKKHSKFTCITLSILPVTMTCAVLCWQTYLGTYSSAFCHIWALKKAFEKSNKCQR